MCFLLFIRFSEEDILGYRHCGYLWSRLFYVVLSVKIEVT